MSGISKLILVGRLGHDASLRYTKGEQPTPVISFSVASSESWTDRGGQKHKLTEWTECTLFGKLGEKLHPYLKTGSMVYIEGKKRTREYEARDGSKKKTVECQVDEISLLGDAPQSHAGQGDERPPIELPQPSARNIAQEKMRF